MISKTIGLGSVIIGTVLFLIPIGLTVYELSTSTGDCSNVANTQPGLSDPSLAVYVPETQLGLNRKFCIGIRPSRYFAAEWKELIGKRDAAIAAEGTLESAKQQAITDFKSRTSPTTAEQKEQDGKIAKFDSDISAAHVIADREKAAAEAALKANSTVKPVSLFVNDVRTPTTFNLYVVDPKAGEDGWSWRAPMITAPSDATSDDAKLWRQILAGTSIEGVRLVRVGIGDPKAQLPLSNAIAANTVPFEVFDLRLVAMGAAGILLVAAGITVYSWNTGMLRNGSATAPFSLARVQMAWWLVIVIGGFIFIWVVLGQSIGVITSGVLALLGISGVSGLAARLIDARPPSGGTAPSVAVSKGFFIDILSDGANVALHRVQMMAWTLILGMITIWGIWSQFSFPQFDQNLLVLAGIVNGVYLGFKFPEK
jgi:hypothetical protein